MTDIRERLRAFYDAEMSDRAFRLPPSASCPLNARGGCSHFWRYYEDARRLGPGGRLRSR